MIEQEIVKEHYQVSVAALYPSERNFRSHPPEQVHKIKMSLERFGQMRDIVCRDEGNGSYTILAGHGVVEAAQQLKMSQLHATILPPTFSDLECNAYIVADNLLSADAVDDDALLAELLTEQQNAGYDLVTLGSDDETLRQMLEGLGDEVIGRNADKLPEEGNAEQTDVAERWGIIIDCQNEQEQLVLLDRFQGEGITCRALVL